MKEMGREVIYYLRKVEREVMYCLREEESDIGIQVIYYLRKVERDMGISPSHNSGRNSVKRAKILDFAKILKF